MSNGANNAFHLLELLVGATVETKRADAARTSISRTELVIEKLREDIRAVIDANFPVIYLVDAQVIVNSMLEAISPKNLFESTFTVGKNKEDKKELITFFKYFSTLDVKKGESTLSEFTEGTYLKTQIIKKGFITKEEKVVDANLINSYINKHEYLVNNKTKIAEEIVKELDSNIKNSVKIDTISKEINTVFQDFSNKLALAIVSKPYRMERVMSTGKLLKRKFSSYGVTRIEDPDTVLAGYNKNIQRLVTGQSYTLTTGVVHPIATKVLIKYITNNTDSNIKLTPTPQFQAGNFAAAGHSALKVGNNYLGINTPLLMIANLILAKAGKATGSLFNNFITTAGHAQYAIEVKENFSTTSTNLFSIGISILQSQPAVINSGTLSPAEVKEVNNALKTAGLSASYSDLSKDLKKEFNKKTTLQYLSNTFRMSPTLVEYIKTSIIDIFNNKKTASKKGVAKNKKEVKPTVTNISKAKIDSKKGKVTNTTLPSISRVSTIKDIPATNTNLPNLLNQINGLITDTVKRNMGTGDRKDILNLRTGRFAESVKVERLSESRAGMITAFYSYMKYPYATFSQGGRQQYPRTRDPKLLISKSIREIAQTMVTNKLRAVNV